MFTRNLAQITHLSWRVLQHSKVPLISHKRVVLLPASLKFLHVTTRQTPSFWYSGMACGSETTISLCSDNKITPDVEKPYQVVVAATRDMGIGKDGKLPWNLPSDLRFFKEVTTTTFVSGKKNAVIMGRRTWESIPQKYQPLPGRLNVVLTRSGFLGPLTHEDLVICSNLQSALRLLAKPPHSLSVDKVFVIGGGQVLKEALNAPGCESVHLTDIETNIECDTFMPRIDSSLFRPLHSSIQMVENNIHFSFVTYVRLSNSAESASENSTNSSPNTETPALKVSESHNELDYLKQLQQTIASENTKDDSIGD